MLWKELKKSYSSLLIKATGDIDFSKEWKKFSKIAYEIEKSTASSFFYSLFIKYFKKEK